MPADGEAADALLPQQPGQLHQPGTLAVAGEHRVDHGLARPLLNDADVVLYGLPLDDQRFHGPASLSCLVFSIIYSQKVSVNEKGFPLVFRQEK